MRTLKIILGGPAAGLILSAVLSCASPRTELIRGENGAVAPNSVAELLELDLNGAKQWVMIRGYDSSKPVLLFLHGGPGAAEIPIARKASAELEKHFVVVNWDQRGSGKSWKAIEPRSNMNIAQFVSDTHALTGWLKKRFGKEKIFLCGHSWGSILGVLTVQKYPEDYQAYIGIGQAVDMARNEKIIYDFVLSNAKAATNREAVEEMTRYGPPPHFLTNRVPNRDAWFKPFYAYRKWLALYKGEIHDNPKGNQDIFVKGLMSADEYGMDDKMHYIDALMDSPYLMWDELLKVDLIKQAPELLVPVYFMTGRFDMNTPYLLAEEYFAVLKAPKKDWTWFENSAHSLNYEEPELFQKMVIEKVLRENPGR